MEELIQAKYTHFECDDPDYPSLDGLSHQHVFVSPRPTKASLGNALVAKERRDKYDQQVYIIYYLFIIIVVLSTSYLNICV